MFVSLIISAVFTNIITNSQKSTAYEMSPYLWHYQLPSQISSKNESNYTSSHSRELSVEYLQQFQHIFHHSQPPRVSIPCTSFDRDVHYPLQYSIKANRWSPMAYSKSIDSGMVEKNTSVLYPYQLFGSTNSPNDLVNKTLNDNNTTTLPHIEYLDIGHNSKELAGLPTFLKGASNDVKQKFIRIVSDQDKTFTEKQVELDDLIAGLDKNARKLYDDVREQKDREEREKRNRIHTVVATMSREAQTIFAKVSTILTNPRLKDRERYDRLKKLYSAMDNTVKNEFEWRFADLIRL
ncbi:hypothetical protein AB6A40_001683 [Gnathostoma spinigerum]|uniref:SXP/RAL-2 family protein Ani s 5-like cation-binding domain-containing protein n=1 Tax=Gnathostoma spinigerum TaxID=75299 RepID=A0ABD6ECA6_9BILA